MDAGLVGFRAGAKGEASQGGLVRADTLPFARRRKTPASLERGGIRSKRGDLIGSQHGGGARRVLSGCRGAGEGFLSAEVRQTGPTGPTCPTDHT